MSIITDFQSKSLDSNTMATEILEIKELSMNCFIWDEN